jgi:hypothetical protein
MSETKTVLKLEDALRAWFARLSVLHGVKQARTLNEEDKNTYRVFFQFSAKDQSGSPAEISLWHIPKTFFDNITDLYVLVPFAVSWSEILPHSDEFEAIRYSNVRLRIFEKISPVPVTSGFQEMQCMTDKESDEWFARELAEGSRLPPKGFASELLLK